MATPKTRKPPVPKDIKAGHKLLEELAQARAENRELNKANTALGREIDSLQRKAATKAKGSVK